ncbi:MAG: hypothetical protein L6R45_27440 [Anaerolineae bacterium]|nr:hypothetical protein [Anaerolineae bacterium]
MILPTLVVNLLVEGDTDEVIIRRVLEYAGLECGTVYGKHGKSDLLKRLPNYNQAARFGAWLAVVDLDRDTLCASDFVRNTLPEPMSGMCFRVAVRAIESWLLADAEHLAAYLGISPTKIPPNPDLEIDPKTTLINLARLSHRKALRQEIVPRQGSGGRVGPGYTARLIEFVLSSDYTWRPEVAIHHSESLKRCVTALQKLKNQRLS